MSKHLKRLHAPRPIRLHRKERKWTIRAAPGPHEKSAAIPLGLLVRDYLHLCDTYREAKRLMNKGEILIDGVIRKDSQFPIGLMDVITIPTLKKHFRVLFDRRGKLTIVPIQSSESTWKLRRIEGKTILRGKRTQLQFHDGETMIVDKDSYRKGDVVKVTFAKKKIDTIYPREKGTISLVIGGSHIGELATLESVEPIQSSKPNVATMKGDHTFVTLEDYVFPVGKAKAIIALPEVKIHE
jgi:small subunit ribosomal protein S4e